MSGKSSQAKGRRGERELAALLQQHGYDVRPGEPLNYGKEADLVGARLAYAMQTGQEELFSLDDVAAALGCTKEEAAAEMERHGIQGMTISTLPGFEWLLGKM